MNSTILEAKNLDLFDSAADRDREVGGKILFELKFQYGPDTFSADQIKDVCVRVDQEGDEYTFRRINRATEKEKEYIEFLRESGLHLKGAQVTLDTPEAFTWIRNNQHLIAKAGIELEQSGSGKEEKKYFLGKSEITIEIKENIDWFDIHALVKFGEFIIPFTVIRNAILKNKREIKLPNGQIAVIPQEWFDQYSDLIAFSSEEDEDLKLEKHHISLVRDLNESNLAKLHINQKLQKLKDFDKIDETGLIRFFQRRTKALSKGWI